MSHVRSTVASHDRLRRSGGSKPVRVPEAGDTCTKVASPGSKTPRKDITTVLLVDAEGGSGESAGTGLRRLVRLPASSASGERFPDALGPTLGCSSALVNPLRSSRLPASRRRRDADAPRTGALILRNRREKTGKSCGGRSRERDASPAAPSPPVNPSRTPGTVSPGADEPGGPPPGPQSDDRNPAVSRSPDRLLRSVSLSTTLAACAADSADANRCSTDARSRGPASPPASARVPGTDGAVRPEVAPDPVATASVRVPGLRGLSAPFPSRTVGEDAPNGIVPPKDPPLGRIESASRDSTTPGPPFDGPTTTGSLLEQQPIADGER